MTVTSDASAADGRLTVPARATIEAAAALKDALQERLARGGTLVVDARQVAEYDASFVQLLCSACRSAEAASLPLLILVTEHLRQGLADTGFGILVERCDTGSDVAQEKEELQ